MVQHHWICPQRLRLAWLATIVKEAMTCRGIQASGQLKWAAWSLNSHGNITMAPIRHSGVDSHTKVTRQISKPPGIFPRSLYGNSTTVAWTCSVCLDSEHIWFSLVAMAMWWEGKGHEWSSDPLDWKREIQRLAGRGRRWYWRRKRPSDQWQK